MRRTLPGLQEFRQMRLLARAQQRLYALDFLCVALARETCAHELETQVDEVGIEYVRLAILAYADEITCPVGIPDLRAGEAHLARQSEQAGRVGQGGTRPALVARQDIHEIDVPPVKTAQVVVVAERGVFLACLPIAGRLHAGQQCPVVKDRQVEARAIPRDQGRGELLDTVEEALDDLPFRSLYVTEAPDTESVAAAQYTGDGDDAVLFMGEKFTTRSLPAQGKHGFCDLAVGQAIQTVKTAAERDVRDRLDIEHQGVHEPAFINTATATTRPASSVSVTCPSPTPRPRRSFSPRSENTTSGFPQEFCTTPTSRIHTPCAKPVPIALTMASLAAKRMAMKRAGRWVRASCSRSCGISR